MIKFVMIVAALSASLTGLSATAQTAAPQSQRSQCYEGSNLRSRMVVGGDTLLIEDAWGKYALLKLGSPCRNMDDFDKIGFEFDGSTQICGPNDVKILHSRNTEAPLRCLIETITPLTKEEAKAYYTPKPAKPK